MFCLVNSHSIHSFRSEHPLHHYPLKGVFTTFLQYLFFVCVVCCFFCCCCFTKVYFYPSCFFFHPDPHHIYIIYTLGSMSLYYNLCHFYHSQWLHLLLPPGVLFSFNFDTCLHYLTERNSRGLERTAGNGLYSFPEVVTIE